MPTEVYLLKVGMTMTEGTVAEWYVTDGAEVKDGELLYRLETEKVEMDVDAMATGTVRHGVAAGTTLEPGAVIGHIFAPGEPVPDVLPAAGEPPAASPPVARASDRAAPSSDSPRLAGGRVPSSPAARRVANELGIELGRIVGSGPGGRVVEADVRAAAVHAPDPVESGEGAAAAERAPASPLARRRARELGVDLARVRGSGPRGRITREDVEAAAQAAAAAPAHAEATPIPATAPRAGDSIPVRGMRRTIARRMLESLQTSAQLTMDMEVAMDDAVRLREQLVAEWESEGIRPTHTDLVTKAVGKALRQHPIVNSEFRETEIALLEEINVGIAVAVEQGLVVPVIRGADGLSVKEISIAAARLARAAREGTLGLDDMHGGTFTVSALGMYGVDSFTPILNPPQVGILGVNRIHDGVAWDGDRPLRRKLMRLSLTWDHRALDGAPAALFLATVRDLLESPYRLLV